MRVSVIIPVYNAEEFLDSTIQSVLMQEEVGEVLLINDASTDRSKEICLEWKVKSDKVKYFESDINRGSAHARNIGLDNAVCEFISFLDADDLFLENRFVEALRILDAHDDIDGTYEKVKNVKLPNFRESYWEQEEIIGVHFDKKPEELFNLFAWEKGYLFHIISLIIRNQKLKKIRFDEQLIVAQDIDFSYSITQKLRLKSIDNKIQIIRRLHSTNITSSEIHRTFNQGKKIVAKWYNKSLNENLGAKANRAFLYRYINHIYLEKGGSKTDKLRYIKKIFIIFKEIFKHPFLIKKLTLG